MKKVRGKRIEENIEKYFQIKERISSLRKILNELEEAKKEIAEDIIKYMNNKNYTEMIVKNYKVVRTTKNVYEPDIYKVYKKLGIKAFLEVVKIVNYKLYKYISKNDLDKYGKYKVIEGVKVDELR